MRANRFRDTAYENLADDGSKAHYNEHFSIIFKKKLFTVLNRSTKSRISLLDLCADPSK